MISTKTESGRNRLSPAFFAQNRQNLKNYLGDHYLALVAAGRPPLRTADEEYAFFANRNFFYLTGIEEENAILLLFRQGRMERDILFIQAKDPLQERWTGFRPSRDQASACSGMSDIAFLAAFEDIVKDLLKQGDLRIWLDHSANNAQAADIRSWLEARRPETDGAADDDLASEADFSDLTPFLIQLRMQKSPEEIALIRDAIALTGRGIHAMLGNLRPGMREYQLCSHFQHALAMEGCLIPAFPSIVASGANAFCLHYTKLDSEIRTGDLVQVDVGAFAGGLSADISRVLPANGRFNPRQMAIYRLVRECLDAALAAIRPGVRLKDINERFREVAAAGLTALGIAQPDGSVSDYCWHGIVHHLGMDVHDIANREALLQPGMVLAVEPGIYVPEWQVGIRIEDDVLVTEDGCEVLSRAIPREAWEIEAALQTCVGRL